MLYNNTVSEEKLKSSHLEIFEENIHLPKDSLNKDAVSAEVAYRLIKDEMVDEGNARQNLATFCQTYVEPEAEKLMGEFMAINAIDKSEYPQMTELENRCVNIIADLWNAEEGEAMGTSTVGSSEACMLGGLAMKMRWTEQATEIRLDKNAQKPNIVISSGYQVCWEKFCCYWDVELRTVPMDEEHMSLNIETVMDYVDDYTIGIIGILGITYTGKFDDIKKLDDLVEKHNNIARIKIGIHVDAASGGLFVPFVHPGLKWDFTLKNVHSINTSGHKYGLVYPGIGWILWRNKKYVPEKLVFYVNYLGGEEPTMSINFSRSGSQIIGQYYVFFRYGLEGLQMIQRHTLNTAQHLAKTIESFGIFNIYNDASEIPIVCYALKDPDVHKWTLYELADRLAMKGWQVPAYTLPENLKHILIQRIVVRADFSVALADSLMRDMKEAIEYLEKHTLRDAPGKDSNIPMGFTH